MAVIFDSHAHYDDEAFEPDREALLSQMPENEVALILNVGVDLESSKQAHMLSQRFPYVYAAAGFHPETCGKTPDNYLEQLRNLLSLPKMVAVGEIGLDYHYDDMEPKEVQKRVFSEQIQLAQELSLPVIVHDRDAHGDTMELLRKYRPRGVVHCFSGSVEMMREVVALGMYIGLGGAVTFKNARVPVAVAKEVPLERLLLETDAPYMAPVPVRGKRCDSSFIRYTAQKIAEIRGEPYEKIVQAGYQNACSLFQITP